MDTNEQSEGREVVAVEWSHDRRLGYAADGADGPTVWALNVWRYDPAEPWRWQVMARRKEGPGRSEWFGRPAGGDVGTLEMAQALCLAALGVVLGVECVDAASLTWVCPTCGADDATCADECKVAPCCCELARAEAADADDGAPLVDLAEAEALAGRPRNWIARQCQAGKVPGAIKSRGWWVPRAWAEALA